MTASSEPRSGFRFAALVLVCAILALTGCAGHQQSAIDPTGPQAGKIATLLWFFVWLLTAIFVIVMALTLWTLMRRHRGIDQEPLEATHKPSEQTETRLTRVVTAATVATVLILFILLGASVFTGKAIASLGNTTKNGMVIELTGNQWWWQVQYDNPDSSRVLVTANEIHIPVGRPVLILGKSNDVIHSFWVPSLAGKQDLIPGRDNDITVVPKTVGIFRGQCAEFCGAQHAHMAMVVVVESYPDFLKWWQHQLQPAVAPKTPLTLAGYKYVTSGPCSTCHSIGGTPASATVGPDLTHLASRKSLAAGTLPMSTGNLYGWVEDPQSLKPGVKMPTIGLEPQQLHAVVAYLETLK